MIANYEEMDKMAKWVKEREAFANLVLNTLQGLEKPMTPSEIQNIINAEKEICTHQKLVAWLNKLVKQGYAKKETIGHYPLEVGSSYYHTEKIIEAKIVVFSAI